MERMAPPTEPAPLMFQFCPLVVLTGPVSFQVWARAGAASARAAMAAPTQAARRGEGRGDGGVRTMGGASGLRDQRCGSERGCNEAATAVQANCRRRGGFQASDVAGSRRFAH